MAQEGSRDYDGAIASCTRAIELDESRASRSLAYRGGIYAKFGRWEQATSDFERAVALKPDDPTVRNCYGAALGNADRDAEALVHYDRAVELNPTDAMYRINRGRCKRDLKRVEEALRDPDEAVRLGPEAAAGYAGRAGCHFQMKNPAAAALADLGAAFQRDPDCLCALRLRAAYRESRREDALACQDLVRIVDRDPTDTKARLRLLMLMMNMR